MFIFLIPLIVFFTEPIQANLYTIYAHGIASRPCQIKHFLQAITTNKDHTKSVTFPDTQKETGYGINRLISEITTYTKKPINRSKMYMGQTKDIEALHGVIQDIPSDHNIILFACSRGAATSINELGQNNPKNIAALILDASPSCMHETIHPVLAKLGIHQSYDKAIFSTLFPRYPQDATSPLESIKTIKNKNLPILLIHSQNDSKVPYDHSLQLYKEFCDNGFKNVYLATIPQGRHSFLLQDTNAKDSYLQAVHSFYKQHNLPHNEQFAQNDMTLYQPDIVNIKSQLEAIKYALQRQYEQNKQRNLIGVSLISALLISYLLHKQQKN